MANDINGRSLCPFCKGNKERKSPKDERMVECTECNKHGRIKNKRLVELKMDNKINYNHELDFNESKCYGDNQYYFNCYQCGEQHCVWGSHEIEVVKCNCGSSYKINFSF